MSNNDPYYPQPQQPYNNYNQGSQYPPQQPYNNYDQSAQYPPPQHNYNNDSYQPQYTTQPSKDDKFTDKPKFNDIWAAILFILHIGCFIVFSIFMLKTFKSSNSTNNSFFELRTMAGYVTACVISFILGVGYLFLMQMMPKFLIKLSFILSIILTFLSAIYFITLRNSSAYILAAFAFFSGLIQIFLYFNWRSRMPFASTMLKTVAMFTRRYPGTIVVGSIILIINSAWCIYWALTLISSVNYYCPNQKNNNEKCKMPGKFYGIMVFMLFSLYWTTQLLKDITHTTIAGTFASDYFFPQSTRFGTIASLRRTLTTSFGSVCFGSLLVSIVRLLRALANQASHDSENGILAFLACCLACILSQIEYLLEYFNTYAYSYVAMYGTSYLNSGKQTWNLIKDRGVDAIVNDSLIGNVLGIGSFVISIVAATIGFIVLLIVKRTGSSAGQTVSSEFILSFAIMFILAMATVSVIMQVVDSANSAFFVCLAEDPQALQQYNPALYNKICERYPQVVTPV